MQPILREAKVVQIERKSKSNTSWKFAFAEMQPILRKAKVVARRAKTIKTAIGGGYGLEVSG